MTRLDPDIKTDAAQTGSSPFETVGEPGTAIYGGYLVEEEKDSRLTGREKYRTYSNILANTSIVAAGTRYFLNLVSKAGWKVKAAEDSGGGGEDIAELIENIIHSMTTPWHRVVRRAAMYRFYGFSIQEWTAIVRDDGVIGFKEAEPRPQITIERWDSDSTGRVLGMIQRSAQTQKSIYLPRGKTLYMVDDTLNDSPEGLGLFRHLVKTAKALDRYEILEGWGFERDLRGTPVGRGPLAEMRKLVQAGTLSSEDATALKDPIDKFIRNALKGKDTALFLDSAPYRGTGDQQTPLANAPQWSIELLKGGATTSQEAIAGAIERLNREMARVLGVEHLLLGENSRGSFALSRDKTQSFGLIVDSTLREIKETFEADVLDPLFELNGWDVKLKPTFQIEQIQYRDIEQVTTALADMAKAGASLVPDDPAINEVRDLLGLSHQSEAALDLNIPAVPVIPIPDEETPPDEGGGNEQP